MRLIDATTILQRKGLLDFPLARKAMIQQLECYNCKTQIIEAIRSIPRQAFVPPHLWRLSYSETSIITDKTLILPPLDLAKIVSSLEIRPNKSVLEVGTGTGYQTAVLSLIFPDITTIDCNENCCLEALNNLRDLDINVTPINNDVLTFKFFQKKYDIIVVDSFASEIPSVFLDLLSPNGGQLIIPVGSLGYQRLLLVIKHNEQLRFFDLGKINTIPLVKGNSRVRSMEAELEPSQQRKYNLNYFFP